MTLLPAFLDIPIESPIDGGELVCISSLRSFVISKLSNQAPLLVIAPSTRIAEELADEIRSYLGDVVSNFPAWDLAPRTAKS